MDAREQLRTARALQDEHDLHFPLIHGNAESVPLPDASFDLVVSEYGASIWADPYRWIPEASRLLRPGGLLVEVTAVLGLPGGRVLDGTDTHLGPVIAPHARSVTGFESVVKDVHQ